MSAHRRQWLPWLGVGLVGLVLSYIALGHPGPDDMSVKVSLIPFEEYVWTISCLLRNCESTRYALKYLAINGLGNVVVFMPLGSALYIALQPICARPVGRIGLAALLGMMLSISYEIIQLWIPGRLVAADDVIMNLVGAILGACLSWFVLALWRRHEGSASTPAQVVSTYRAITHDR